MNTVDIEKSTYITEMISGTDGKGTYHVNIPQNVSITLLYSKTALWKTTIKNISNFR